jgi:hypothetical protein
MSCQSPIAAASRMRHGKSSGEFLGIDTRVVLQFVTFQDETVLSGNGCNYFPNGIKLREKRL